MPVKDITTTVQSQVLDAVKAGQDAALDAVKNWAPTVTGMLPDRSSLPFADQLPEPAEIVDGAFGFVEKLLSLQRDFTGKLLAATAGPTAGA